MTEKIVETGPFFLQDCVKIPKKKGKRTANAADEPQHPVKYQMTRLDQYQTPAIPQTAGHLHKRPFVFGQVAQVVHHVEHVDTVKGAVGVRELRCRGLPYPGQYPGRKPDKRVIDLYPVKVAVPPLLQQADELSRTAPHVEYAGAPVGHGAKEDALINTEPDPVNYPVAAVDDKGVRPAGTRLKPAGSPFLR
jgi:hypothetical protein